MCVPLVALAVGAAVVGAGVQAYGAISAGNRAAAGYEFTAAQARQQAQLEQEKAEWDIGRVQDNTRRVMGAQRAGYSAAGIAIDEGTPMSVAFDTLSESEKDIYAIQWGANVRSANYENAARGAEFNAESSRSAGRIGAFSAVVGGVGNIATMGAGGSKAVGTAFSQGVTRLGATIFG